MLLAPTRIRLPCTCARPIGAVRRSSRTSVGGCTCLIWPHPQQSSQRLSGPAFVYSSTLYRTPAAGTPSLTSLCATFFPFTMKTADDALISPLCSLNWVVRGFDSHLTWAGITTPSFSAWISSLIFCSPSVPLPMNLTSRTLWIFSLSHDSFLSTSMILLSTDLVPLMMISRYKRAIFAVAFRWLIAVIVPLAFRLAFIIRTCAGACCWNSALLTADPISSSILLGRGMPSSLHETSHLTAILEPDVGAGPGLCPWARCWKVSHLLAHVGADFGLGAGCGLRCSLSCSLGFDCCCGCWCCSGPSSRVVSACCDAYSPPPSILAVFSLSFSVSLPGLVLHLSWPLRSCLWCPPPTDCHPHGRRPICALSLASTPSFLATVPFRGLPGLHTGLLGVQLFGAAALAPVPAVVSSFPWGSSSRWGPLRPRSSFSVFRSHFSPLSQIWLRPQSPRRWMSPLSPSPSPDGWACRSSHPPLLPCPGRSSRSFWLRSSLMSSTPLAWQSSSLLACLSTRRHIGSVVFFAETSREPTQLRGFSCATSSCGLAGAGKLAPGSIRRLELIAAARFSIAIIVVDLTRCFCFAKTFVYSMAWSMPIQIKTLKKIHAAAH